MKKILFYIYSLNKGGAERVLVNLTTELSKYYDVIILTDTVDELEYDCPENVKRIVIGACGAKERLKAIRRCCKEEKPDAVIAFMISSAMRAIVANLFSKYKVIAAVRSNPYDDFGSVRQRIKLCTIFGFAKTIVCQTEYQKEYFPKILRKKCEVILNPLVGEFCNRKIITERKKEIVSVGRLFDYKNHLMLIKAYDEIKEKYEDYCVRIYGEGPYRRELEKEIDRYGLKDKVFLPGDVNDVAARIEEAALFVLPSDTEGMPNALIEAMALGVPCISTDCPCGGPKTLIKHGENGLLCEVNDYKGLSRLMDEVLENKDLQLKLSKNGSKIVLQTDITTIAKKWSELFDGK